MDELLNDLGNSSGTNGSAALTDSETKSLLHSYGMDKINLHLYVITRHAHLSTSGKYALTGNVGCSEIELRSVV